MSIHYHFDDRYQEEARLADGTVVRLRLVRPEDRERLRRGFDRLSSESRYLRFMGPKPALTDEELDLLTDLDGVNRFAIGAERVEGDGDGEGDGNGAGDGDGDGDGEPEGIGVARFVRRPEEPDVAEAAVTVADGWQGRGLGSLLLRRLAAAARERGVRRFQGEILVRNAAMRQLLADRVEATVVEAHEDVLRVLVELPSQAALMGDTDGEGDLLGRLLAQAARGSLRLRMSDLLLKRR